MDLLDVKVVAFHSVQAHAYLGPQQDVRQNQVEKYLQEEIDRIDTIANNIINNGGDPMNIIQYIIYRLSYP